MAYVYRHIRLDTNQPFYIGIGDRSKDEYDDLKLRYKRAYSKMGRNSIWKKIVNKTEYEVEILMNGISWEKACEKEKEFITLYGRINTNTGILCNLTDGGEGANGYVPSQEAINKTRNNTDYSYNRNPEKIAKTDYSYNRNPEKIAKGIKNTDYSYTKTADYSHNKNRNYSYLHTPEMREKIKNSPNRLVSIESSKKPIEQYTKNGEYIQSWPSSADASRYLKKLNGAADIRKCCYNKIKSAHGYVWRFSNEYTTK